MVAEIEKEIGRIVRMVQAGRKAHGGPDLEALEMDIRTAVQGVGAIILENLINADLACAPEPFVWCEAGHQVPYWDTRAKHLRTVLGEIVVQRHYYYDRECGQGFCPKDKTLRIEGKAFSPGVLRMMGRTGADQPFGRAAETINELAGIEVAAKEVERACHELGRKAEQFLREMEKDTLPAPAVFRPAIPIFYVALDGTGVPVVRKETEGRAGKGEDGRAKTREVKLGCVFTQTGVDKKGRPVRDEDSTTYVGAIETAEEFSPRIYGEACRREMEKARTVCVLGDGAAWIWNIAEEQFPGAVQVVDLFHACEHVWNVAKEAFPADRSHMEVWARARSAELQQGKPEAVAIQIRTLLTALPGIRKTAEKEAAYFEKNKERMRYARFRKKGLFVGSGVLEAGCRSVIGQRLKQSGMHWSVAGANSIIALRCCLYSERWEDFWEFCSGF